MVIKSSKNLCFICRNFFSATLSSIIDRILKCEIFSTNLCEYKINIGTKLPVFLYENEDYIRSMFKIRGIPNIKNQINSIIRKEITKSNRCKIEYVNPEFRFDISVKDDFSYVVSYNAREFYLLGKYNKLRRGIYQKYNRIDETMYRKLKDSDKDENEISVEQLIRRSVCLDYGTDNVKITWTGSEDKESLVLGNGRPFVVKVCNPKSKTINNEYILYNGIGLNFRKINYLDIEKYYRYRLIVIILVKIEMAFVDRNSLERLVKKLIGEISFRVKNKLVIRKIYQTELKKIQDNRFELILHLDNGIPIKQLIGGLHPIKPSLSNILGMKCECIYFDIQDVILNSS